MRDFLVIYEGDDEGDDKFVVDIHRKRRQTMGALEVEHDLELGLQNTSSKIGLTGFIVSILGGIIALIAMIAFAMGYPEMWAKDADLIRLVTTTALVGLLTMIAGVALTHYGRRIQAQGRLNSVRVVEMSTDPHASLR